MAQIGWVDFSPKDRERVGSILDMLKPEGQIDELGIGTIRDALANQMFPGISTIQTKAKYFFIICYILQDFLRLPVKDRKKKSPVEYLREQEFEIMWYLAEKYEYQLGTGVIGITKKRPEIIVRRPSAIYWNGLNTFGCLNSRGLSATAFLSQANKANQETLIQTIEEDGSGDDADADFDNFFNIKTPVPDLHWKTDLDLNLNEEEASFLQSALKDQKGSVLSAVMQEVEVQEKFFSCDSFADFAKSAVTLPIGTSKHTLVLAHDFGMLIEGAHIAYNQELQKQFFHTDPFERDWEDWFEQFRQSMLDFSNFDPENLFLYAKTARPQTAQFIRDWWQLTSSGKINEKAKSALIRNQESFAKQKKARLKYSQNTDVEEGHRIGLGLLNYRYSNAKTIVEDIITGLENYA